MKMSAKVEYACRAVLELALRYGERRPVRIKTIARSQNIPKDFLLQILIRLKNAGIVESSRGVAGGYYLAKAPSDITLADVITAIDGGILKAARGPRTGASVTATDVVRVAWEEANRELLHFFDGITFDDMRSQTTNEQLTYHI